MLLTAALRIAEVRAASPRLKYATQVGGPRDAPYAVCPPSSLRAAPIELSIASGSQNQAPDDSLPMSKEQTPGEQQMLSGGLFILIRARLVDEVFLVGRIGGRYLISKSWSVGKIRPAFDKPASTGVF